ncbi:MAG TPA: CcdC protein domain-containing protein [Rhizomicrobium sp.]|jgi:hypothetical protein|nr:CcdC protein domain-containing protein [Rhizomicrobium sp.]
MQDSQLQFFLPFLILLPILYFRMRKLSRPQPLKLKRLWIRPAIILLACALVLFAPQPGTHMVRHFTAMEWSWLVLAGVLGAAIGWQVGRTMKIEVHPEDGTLVTTGGQAAILVLVMLVLVRMGLKTGVAIQAETWHLDALLISDASIVFTAALFTVRSLEMFLRARRVMKEAGR